MQKKWIIILSAIVGGLLFNYINIPAGAMVGSILGVATTQIITKTKLHIAVSVKRFVRIVMGCYIGLGITIEGVRQLSDIGGGALIVMGGVMMMSFLVTYFLHKFCNWELHEAYLSSLPAGLSEMGMSAEEFNVDIIKVTTIHLMRLITIVIIIPLILKFF